MKGQQIRAALHQGRPVYATALVAPGPHFPDVIKDAQADFVFIDTEHTPLGRETVAWMCHVLKALDIPPVVRLPSPDAHEAAKILDGGGGGGIIGPYIETVEQVRALVGAARWAPLKGQRLLEVMSDPSTLEPKLRDHLESRNEDTILILTIESVPAIENLDELLAVPGVDGVLVGPYDLSCSLGIPHEYESARFQDAVRTIFRKARAHHVGAGVHYWPGVEEEMAWVQAGGNLIMHSAEITAFRQQLGPNLAALRAALGDR
jgi:2-keto-3-deoxy-L-rhamnonate aldolase RhmA